MDAASGITLTARAGSVSAWTGTELVIWGGSNGDQTGARFNPTTNRWTPTSTVGAPSPRILAASAWTGTELFIWGGLDATSFVTRSDGALYNPATDQWRPVSASFIPAPTGRARAVWTGSQVFVMDSVPALYHPTTNRWTSTAVIQQPSRRTWPALVWTGTEVIVWGGLDGSSMAIRGGARYNPMTDQWRRMATQGAPPGEGLPVAVWTGTEFLVWSGYSIGPAPLVSTAGGRYDPSTDTWRTTSTANPPAGRFASAYAWTGAELIVWGGLSGAGLNSGATYSHVLDQWRPWQVIGVPFARGSVAFAWTGTELLVWGGSVDDRFSTVFSDGARLVLP